MRQRIKQWMDRIRSNLKKSPNAESDRQEEVVNVSEQRQRTPEELEIAGRRAIEDHQRIHFLSSPMYIRRHYTDKDPDNFEIYYTCEAFGNYLEEVGDTPESREAFKRILEEPDEYFAQEWLGEDRGLTKAAVWALNYEQSRRDASPEMKTIRRDIKERGGGANVYSRLLHHDGEGLDDVPHIWVTFKLDDQ